MTLSRARHDRKAFITGHKLATANYFQEIRIDQLNYKKRGNRYEENFYR